MSNSTKLIANQINKFLGKILGGNIRQYGMITTLILIMGYFAIRTGGLSLQALNITNLVLQNSYILILAIGMLLVIITGNVDLSVGSVAAFIGALSAKLMIEAGVNFIIAVVISLLAGAFIGALQGGIIAYFKIPAFIVTLGGMLVFRGLTMVLLGGMSLAPFPEIFTKISSGFIANPLGGGNDLHMTTLVIGVILTFVYIYFEIAGRKNKTKYNFGVPPMKYFALKIAFVLVVINIFTFILASYKGIPNILILLCILIIIYAFITNKTIIGRHIYAVGGNMKAAQLSGVKAQRTLVMVYVNMGMLAALSGLAFAARLNAATPKAGIGFELDAIAACFIGGASASGGIGTIIGAIIGGLVMGVMNNGMSLMGVGIDWQQAIKGIVLVSAVLFDTFTKSKGN